MWDSHTSDLSPRNSQDHYYLPGRSDFLLWTKFIWMLQTYSISITPELSASAQKSRAGKLNCCELSGSQMQGGQLSMTCFCEQEVLNMKQSTQGFWLCVFTPYRNAFSSQHPSKAGIWCTLFKDCSVITVANAEKARRENLATFPVLSHSSYGCLTQSEHGTCTGFACSFLHYVPRQACLFSLVCQKTYLWLSMPKLQLQSNLLMSPGCDPFLSQVPFSSEVLC